MIGLAQQLFFTILVSAMVATTNGFQNTLLFSSIKGVERKFHRRTHDAGGAITTTQHYYGNNNEQNQVTLDHEEPLSVLFQRAVALHRAGETDKALDTYMMFIKAAKQCNVEPRTYGEVYVNIGAIQLKRGLISDAKQSFETALKYRSIGTAHVNLAVLILKEASQASSSASSSYQQRHVAIQTLETAKSHCIDAIELNDDSQSAAAAKKLLDDINRMIKQMDATSWG